MSLMSIMTLLVVRLVNEINELMIGLTCGLADIRMACGIWVRKQTSWKAATWKTKKQMRYHTFGGK
jgi:hypothetical protein